MTARPLIEAAAADAMSRLRWRVIERFRLAPDTRLSDADCLWAAANMVLDARETVGGGGNAAFDEGRFLTLKGGG